MRVAVIGAGAAGLASAREFRDRGFDVVVFEQGKKPGGVWAYSPEIEDDPLGRSPSVRVYSSLYENLRTNLPVDLMAFKGFPYEFEDVGSEDIDPREYESSASQRFPHHKKVLAYLERYIDSFDLRPLLRLGEKVVQVKVISNGWQVRTQAGLIEDFNAVAVCSGHFSKPRIPSIVGEQTFTGQKLHSHNYRQPEMFAGKSVAVLGRGASGADIVQELRPHATSILWCGFDEPFSFANVRGLPFPEKVTSDQLSIASEQYPIDVLLYCTGYEYELPFIDDTVVTVEDNCVAPLYQDVVPPDCPTIGFIGLPFLVVPFPLYAMQAKWFAASLDNDFSLPSANEMHLSCETRAAQLKAEGVLKRHWHRLGDKQEAYYNQLADQCGAPQLPQWFGQLALESQQSRVANPAKFRDVELSMPRQSHL